jgi:hypothetical protein
MQAPLANIRYWGQSGHQSAAQRFVSEFVGISSPQSRCRRSTYFVTDYRMRGDRPGAERTIMRHWPLVVTLDFQIEVAGICQLRKGQHAVDL